MENASRALLMAATVLVGVLIASVGVALFSSFAGSSKDIVDRIEESKISQFNNNFFKYYGESQEVTAHDVITMVNVARANNAEYGVESESSYSHSSPYIRIQVRNIRNFEKKTESYYAQFIKDNMLIEDEAGNLTKTKLFKCTKIVTSNETGRVIFVKIEDKN